MIDNQNPFTLAYTNKSLFQLFMVCVFPIHVWALLMGFRDFSWVALRTNVWDALGLMSYSLAFALLETIGIFLIVMIGGFLIPNRIEPEKRLALVGTSFLVTALWLILGQIYSSMEYTLPKGVADVLWQTGHPFRYLWIIVFLLVFLTVSLPLVSIIRRENFKRIMVEVFDRIATLSALYIFFDLVSIVIIAIRNF